MRKLAVQRLSDGTLQMTFQGRLYVSCQLSAREYRPATGHPIRRGRGGNLTAEYGYGQRRGTMDCVLSVRRVVRLRQFTNASLNDEPVVTQHDMAFEGEGDC